MEFYHLRSFVAVAQAGNLTLAAKRLYTTPPAISAHIKALEEELATPLFIRSSKGMCLTDKGRILLKKAQHTLDSALELVNTAAENQHEIMGTFRVGINLSAELVRLAELVMNLRENCPGIGLDVHPLWSGKTLEGIRAHTLDGGYIYGEVPEDMAGIQVKLQAITTVAPKDFDVSDVRTAGDLCAYPWISMGKDCPFEAFLAEKLGNDLASVVKSADERARLELVKSGMGLSFLELEEARRQEQSQALQVISILDFHAPLYFVVAKSRANEPIVRAMLQEIRILWELAI
ncbi:LysR family transcriptional regulator [Shewanella sp. AS16]|uniref:LysR family transcriptional regulator n=1 Tax=Shewanella sp. AS16 TaxID=2907625 RepID=UPI001F207872|nr:LysR family transcriptional regulator [Shewanella sp. AS16]MCE9688148.1 LysR family transcriptional regulator [Shewanella sp. AS16]